MFQVTDEKLDDFHNKYRGSKDEQKEMLELYVRFKGNMKTVFDYLPCSDPDLDSHRFMDAVDASIEADKVEAYSIYTKWKKKIQKTERPKDPLKPVKRSKAGSSAGPSSDLIAAIQKRVCGSGSPQFSNLSLHSLLRV
jgi:DnaJ homolog subfamily C member 9